MCWFQGAPGPRVSRGIPGSREPSLDHLVGAASSIGGISIPSALDEIGRDRRQALVVTFRPPTIFDRDVLPLDIAAFGQTFAEHLREMF
jgi:hypothetical protein